MKGDFSTDRFTPSKHYNRVPSTTTRRSSSSGQPPSIRSSP